MTIEACGSCKFWEPILVPELEGLGWCRRHPPVIDAQASLAMYPDEEPKQVVLEGHWPEIASDDWCGEYQPTPRAPGSS